MIRRIKPKSVSRREAGDLTFALWFYSAGRPGGLVVTLEYYYNWFWDSNPTWVGLLSLLAKTKK